MASYLVQHIELRGDSPTQAVIVGTNLKVHLVAQFALGWTIEEAVENYGLDHATIHAAISFYYDNLDVIRANESESERIAKEYAVDGKAKLEELRKRLEEK